jgi:hypothetical protein
MANHTAGIAWGDTPLTPPPGPLCRDLGLAAFSSFCLFVWRPEGRGEGVAGALFFDSLSLDCSPDDTEESRVRK